MAIPYLVWNPTFGAVVIYAEGYDVMDEGKKLVQKLGENNINLTQTKILGLQVKNKKLVAFTYNTIWKGYLELRNRHIRMYPRVNGDISAFLHSAQSNMNALLFPGEALKDEEITEHFFPVRNI